MCDACTLIGILDDGWAGLGEAARTRIAEADLLIGVERTLELVRPHLKNTAETRDMDGQLSTVAAWVNTAREQRQRTVVLATGDPLCHGISTYLIGKLGSAAIEIVPALSTVQLAFARLKRPWQDARIVSVHGADSGEWDWGAPPAHKLYPLLRAAAGTQPIACFTGPANDPARIARTLIAAGYGSEWRLSVAARLQLPDEALFADLDLADAAQRDFPQPNIVVLERIAPPAAEALFGLPDAAYLQRQPEKGLITKREVRAVSLALLAVAMHDTVWDIGAGSGAVGLEAARLARHGHVWAIEKNAADAAHARANMQRLRATNYTLTEGRAPDGLDAWPEPDAVFIGGSGGALAALIECCWRRLKPNGRLVLNFVTLENLASASATLRNLGANWSATQLQAARTQPILDMHRFAAENPVWVVAAIKEALKK